MTTKALLQDCTATQMDRADGMTFHPCCADLQGRPYKIDGLQFDQSKSQFFWDNGSSWCYYRFDFPRISDGKSRQKEDPYPEHWQFDPFTGEKL